MKWHISRVLTTFAPLWIFLRLGLQAQTQAPCAQIMSPTDKAIMAPRHKIKVVVSASGKYRAMAVLGEEPLGSCLLGLWHRSCYVTVPPDTPLGLYGITVDGTTKDGVDVSDSVDVDVERDEIPSAIHTIPPAPLYLREGASTLSGVLFMATYRDVTVAVNRSTRQLVVPQDATRLSILQEDGKIAPLKAGSTGVVVAGKCCIQVFVKVRKP